MGLAVAFGLASPLAASITPRLARAEAPSAAQQAKEHFSIGAQAYSGGKYDLAVRSFEQAYALLPRAEILFSLAQAERKQCVASTNGPLLQKALKHFREYYDRPDASRKVDAVNAISELVALQSTPGYAVAGAAAAPVATREATRLSVYAAVDGQARGAELYVDGRSRGDLPFSGPVSAGKHHIHVRLAGHVPVDVDVKLAEGTSERVQVRLVERPVGVAFDAPSGTDVHVDGAFVGRTPFPVAGVGLTSGPHTAVLVKNGRRLLAKEFTVEQGKPMIVRAPLEVSTQRIAAYAVGTVGVAGLVASGVFYGIALGEETRAQNRETTRLEGNLKPVGLEQYNAAVANRDTYRAAGTVAALGGLAALSAGALLFVFDKPDPNSVPLRRPDGPSRKPGADFELGFAPLLAPGVAGAGAFGHF